MVSCHEIIPTTFCVNSLISHNKGRAGGKIFSRQWNFLNHWQVKTADPINESRLMTTLNVGYSHMPSWIPYQGILLPPIAPPPPTNSPQQPTLCLGHTLKQFIHIHSDGNKTRENNMQSSLGCKNHTAPVWLANYSCSVISYLKLIIMLKNIITIPVNIYH